LAETGVVDSSFVGESDAANSGQDTINFIIVDKTAVVNVSNPLSNIIPSRDGMLTYKIQSGDNIAKIAANFGISANTIFWANPQVQQARLTPGQEIIILPVSGIVHHVRSGETLESIAADYGVETGKIIQFNHRILSQLDPGSTIIIPGGRPLEGVKFESVRNLPNLPGYFTIPTTGWNWGRLHNYNAVDIANVCGTPIYAAAEGLVTEESLDDWNSGYGSYVLIEHPNGTKTRYAHNQKNLVSVGNYVMKGDQIALIGSTGKTHGPTGCHLHFEVIGAKNPFAK